jgi:hypothetical protein
VETCRRLTVDLLSIVYVLCFSFVKESAVITLVRPVNNFHRAESERRAVNLPRMMILTRTATKMRREIPIGGFLITTLRRRRMKNAEISLSFYDLRQAIRPEFSARLIQHLRHLRTTGEVSWK